MFRGWGVVEESPAWLSDMAMPRFRVVDERLRCGLPDWIGVRRWEVKSLPGFVVGAFERPMPINGSCLLEVMRWVDEGRSVSLIQGEHGQEVSLLGMDLEVGGKAIVVVNGTITAGVIEEVLIPVLPSSLQMGSLMDILERELE